ncbi:uncharacterized protein N7479_010197 [Penicillium vulpinum]|uniref:uncharacterized protein n=1 Tax=Penicillium vulpinum TaxID=29845 RepID=UPI00254732C5|nr:uncharacterized protein N7479_010197 [Penicillium vulpinum]KAJ5951784.1 hypothetical protein N7479_010197 [Penicillium vulpinum]
MNPTPPMLGPFMDMSKSDDARMGKILASSATGTSFLILIQLASRIFTFASNQLILRTLSPVVLGIAAQLELFQVSILYFSRESIRMAIQRQPIPSSPDCKNPSPDADTATFDSHSVASQTVVNMSYLSFALGFPSSLIFSMLYQRFVPEEASNTAFFYHSMVLIGAASLMELSIEPFFSVVQQHMLYEKRAAVEMPAAFLRSAVTSSAFIYASQVNYDLGVLPFALGHLSYSLALICGYSLALLRGTNASRFSFLLTRIQFRDPSNYLLGRFSRQLMSLAANVFFQSLVKHLLTQGDTMMLAALSGLEDQGIYSLASNYGGLIARIIFQPLEESSRNLFSALLISDENGKPKSVHISTTRDHLIDILRAPIDGSSIAVYLGRPSMGFPKIGDLLSVYCYYIPFLAFNGITEAFVSSAASSQQIRKQTAWMGVFSACYALAAYMFLEVGDLGAYGLVLANIVNMMVRTCWSYSFIKSYFHRNGCSLNTSEVAIRPASFFLCALASLLLRRGFGLKLGIIEACALGGTYTLLM